MKIKVILSNGIPEAVLSDGEAEVEIICIDDNYADRKRLEEYAKSLYENPELKELEMTTVNFEEF